MGTVFMSYVTALMDILEAKGVASQEEIRKQIEKQKAFFRKASHEAEFIVMMDQVKKRGKKDK